MSNPFSWDYLTAPVGDTAVWGPFSIAYLIVFATGLAVALFFNYDAPRRLKNRTLLLRTVQRGAWIAIAVFSLGLLFFLFRILQVSALGLHMRIWLYLCALLAVAMVAYFWYYIRVKYPQLAAAEEAEALKRSYIERPAHGRGSGAGGASRAGSGGSRRRRKGRRPQKKRA